MDEIFWLFLCLMVVVILLGVGVSIVVFSSLNAVYRNGVTDGFGYSVEPENPGYAEAGKYLRENMAYRWPELSDNETYE